MKYYLIYIVFFFFSCSESRDQSGNRESWAHHDLKTQQYLIEGRRLYSVHCASCHMEDGKGLARLIPPLAQSDYMKSDPERTICIIKNGLEGEILVNDEVYNHPMPAFKNLTDIEIAMISSYIFNSWGHNRGIITIPQVKEALQYCKK